jgi:hypothetical protein
MREMKADQEPILVGVDTGARMLGLSARSVWALIAAKTLHPVRFGRRTLLRIADLRQLTERKGA